MMGNDKIAAMIANMRAFNTDASRNEASDALEAQAAEAKVAAVNEGLHQAQPYSYIGANGKSILARDLEDQRDSAEAKVAALTAELELARAQLNGLPPAKPGLLRERICEIKSEGEAL